MLKFKVCQICKHEQSGKAVKFGSTDIRLRQEKRKEKKKEKKVKKNEAKQSLHESYEEPQESSSLKETAKLPNFEESFDDEFDYSSIQKTSLDEGIVIDYMTFAQ